MRFFKYHRGNISRHDKEPIWWLRPTKVRGSFAQCAPRHKLCDVAAVACRGAVTMEDVEFYSIKSGSCESGQVKIPIDQRYALKDVQQAHRDLEARKTTGCTVLTLD